MARVRYVDAQDLDPDDQALIDSSAPPEELDPAYQHLMRMRARNSYRTIAHLPPVLRAFRGFVDSVKEHSGLTTTEQEFVILCCARDIPSQYEWHNHARIALNAGLEPDTIRAIATRSYDAFEPAHVALLEYTERFLTGSIDDAAHADLAEHYDEPTIVGIALFAGYWLMNALVVDALGVELEEPFIGWELENL